jgi:hypothetical protein
MNMQRIVAVALAIIIASAAPAGATYTFGYLCGEIRVEATWRREKDNGGTNAVRFMEPLSCKTRAALLRRVAVAPCAATSSATSATTSATSRCGPWTSPQRSTASAAGRLQMKK